MSSKTLSGNGEVFFDDQSLGRTDYTLYVIQGEKNGLAEITGSIDSSLAEVVYNQDEDRGHILTLEDGLRIRFFVTSVGTGAIRAMEGFLT